MNLDYITGGAGFIGSNLIHHVIDDPRSRQARQSRLPDLRRASGESGKRCQASEICFRKSGFARQGRDVARRRAARHHPRHASRGGIARGPLHHRAGRFHLTRTSSARSICSKPAAAFGAAISADKKFHHVSTDEVYGSLGATGFFTETTPYAPNSPYSASKASSDMLVRAYHHTYGLPTVITNCSNNYGPFQFPEKLIPGRHPERARAETDSGLRRRHERARLALRARPRRGAVDGAASAASSARPTTSAATTNGPTSASWN